MTVPTTFRPETPQELGELVQACAAASTRLRIRGGGSKDDLGAPAPEAAILDMGAFSGIIDYDPPELVMTLGAATPLSAIEPLLATHGQMLAFEPYDVAPIFGTTPDRTTIGGIIAAGFSGSQRLTQGAVRDHLLGFTAVSGRGEIFKAGAKVVKNVTGYDLPKLMCGSWGRLAALTEVTLKVLPRPTTAVTMIAKRLSTQDAWALFARLLGSQAEIAAGAHFSAGCVDEQPVTAVRLQGVAPSVAARCEIIKALSNETVFEPATEMFAASLWRALQTLTPLPKALPLWRVSLPARQAPHFLDAVKAPPGSWMLDWAGSLIWLASAEAATQIRAHATDLGGHALLMRAAEVTRYHVPALPPLPPGVAALEARVRHAFDPLGVFETGRF